MKAKELAAIYNAEPTDKKLAEVCNLFMGDMMAIIRQRAGTRGVAAMSDSAVLAILREMEAKWRAMARATGGALVDDGFAILLKESAPDFYLAWQRRIT